MGNKQATAATAQQAVKQVIVKNKPHVHLPLNIVDKNVATDKTLYTYKEDYDMIQKMSNMTEQQRQETIDKNNQEYRAQDEAMRQLDDYQNANAKQQQQASSGFGNTNFAQRSFSSLQDEQFSSKFASQQDKTQTQVQEVADTEQEKDDQFIQKLNQLSGNIVTRTVTKGFIGEMPEYMQGKLARAKVAKFATKQTQRLAPNRDSNYVQHIVPQQQQQVFNRYSPQNISGTVTARELKEFLDSVRDLRYDAEQHQDRQAKDEFYARVAQFANERGIDPAVMHTIIKSMNSLYIFNSQTVTGLWYAPIMYKATKE